MVTTDKFPYQKEICSEKHEQTQFKKQTLNK